jgi:hypothetical protein
MECAAISPPAPPSGTASASAEPLPARPQAVSAPGPAWREDEASARRTDRHAPWPMLDTLVVAENVRKH